MKGRRIGLALPATVRMVTEFRRTTDQDLGVAAGQPDGFPRLVPLPSVKSLSVANDKNRGAWWQWPPRWRHGLEPIDMADRLDLADGQPSVHRDRENHHLKGDLQVAHVRLGSHHACDRIHITAVMTKREGR